MEKVIIGVRNMVVMVGVEVHAYSDRWLGSEGKHKVRTEKGTWMYWRWGCVRQQWNGNCHGLSRD